MAQKNPKLPLKQIEPQEDILNRVMLKDDESAVPEFRELLRDVPSLVEVGGNLAKIAQETLVKELSGGQVYLREMLAAKLDAMRAELTGFQCSPLDCLLVERVIACWLQVYHADAIAAQAGATTMAEAEYDQRRQDRAHRRFLSAVKTLATVRRMALPTLVAVHLSGTVETQKAEPAMVSRPWRLQIEHGCQPGICGRSWRN